MEIPVGIPVVHCPPFVKLAGWAAIILASMWIGESACVLLGLRDVPTQLGLPIVFFLDAGLLAYLARELLLGRLWACNLLLVLTLPCIIPPLLLLLQRSEYYEYCEYRRRQEERERLLLP